MHEVPDLAPAGVARQNSLRPGAELASDRPPSLPTHLVASLDTSKDDVRADVAVCRRAQRTDGGRGVQITRANVLMGDQMDFLIGTASGASRPSPAS